MSDAPAKGPDDGPTLPTLIRTEQWRHRRGADHALLRMAYGDECLCLLLARDPVSRTWSFRKGLFPAEAFNLYRLDIVSAMTGFSDDIDDIEQLGYLSGEGEQLLSLLSQMQNVSRPLAFNGRYAVVSVEARRNLPSATIHGYVARRNCTLDFPLRPMPPGRVSKPLACELFGLAPGPRPAKLELFTIPPPGTLNGTWEQATALIWGWTLRMRARLVHRWTPFMDGSHWSNDLAAFYSHPGDVGRNRRQAGELYPLLAPLISNDFDVGALVDAGRPFEDALCDALDAWVCPVSPHDFTKAKLRTLRHRKPSEDPIPVLKLVAALPHDRLRQIFAPADPVMFSGLKAIKLHAWANRYGLDIAKLTDEMPVFPYYAMSRELDEISDMIRRCAESLAAPSLRDETIDSRIAAARLLFGDRTFRVVQALSLQWHVRMETFEAALPEGKDLVTWPALFESFEHGHERIVCLTRQSELRAEGRGIPDRDGMRGLKHCVGGYGRSSYAGRSHIASVRSNESGTWERLSTVELILVEDGVTVRQHRGPSNAIPLPQAQLALQALVDAIVAREVRLNPDAYHRRDERDFRDGIDYSARGIEKAVLEAWAPYLPARARGLSGARLKAHLHELLGMESQPGLLSLRAVGRRP